MVSEPSSTDTIAQCGRGDRDRWRHRKGSSDAHRKPHAIHHGYSFAPSQCELGHGPELFQQLSNSGVLRALPSTESNLLATQRLPYGNLYLLGLYLQPLQAGGTDTFQRLPEAGYQLPYTSLFHSPVLFGIEANHVNFYREEGFTLNRINVVPGIETDVIHLGHMIGVRPQAKFREVYYTRGAQSGEGQHRETFGWVWKPCRN